jgi:preprotein translocase subunit SecD
MSKIEDLQEQFDRALASMSSPTPPRPLELHKRLRRRRIGLRIAGLTGVCAIIAASLSLGLTSAQKTLAGAVTLHVATGGSLSEKELQADVVVLRSRLVAVGDHHAHVSISGNTILVSGGPAQLKEKNSELLASPLLLVRPVLCYSGTFHESSALPSGTISSNCIGSPYQLQPVIPAPGTSGYTNPNNHFGDPALSQFPSTTPAQDSANPNTLALLPSASSNSGRYVVGPVELTLTSEVASAQATQDHYGNWIVNIQLSPKASQEWDSITRQYFHRFIGIDLDGQIVSAPVIEPTQSAFTSFEGKMEIGGGFTKSEAAAVAATLQSGPLPIPLQS